MTPDEFDAALAELNWKGTDFCARTGLVPNTVWRWRKALAPVPAWAGEYLRAMLAMQRLHSQFVAVTRSTAGTGRTEVRESVAGDAAAAAEEPA